MKRLAATATLWVALMPGSVHAAGFRETPQDLAEGRTVVGVFDVQSVTDKSGVSLIFWQARSDGAIRSCFLDSKAKDSFIIRDKDLGTFICSEWRLPMER